MFASMTAWGESSEKGLSRQRERNLHLHLSMQKNFPSCALQQFLSQILLTQDGQSHNQPTADTPYYCSNAAAVLPSLICLYVGHEKDNSQLNKLQLFKGVPLTEQGDAGAVSAPAPMIQPVALISGHSLLVPLKGFS